ncbi:ABC transporter permease [Candidatus Micrarchaeota archaeon]|nr:ABC transporter permease [Candidatus Micrarchaeota archaeon]
MKLLSAVRKELREISHDRTMLVALIVFPIVIMVLMGSAFRSIEIKGLPIGLVTPENATFSSTLAASLNESKAFNLQRFPTEGSARSAFKNGQLRALILVPDDFENTLTTGSGSQIRIILDNSDLALEQSIVAAMGSVVQASSANITKTYVSGAWGELKELNRTASDLAQGIATNRAKMLETKEAIRQIKDNISNLNIDSLDNSLSQSSRIECDDCSTGNTNILARFT